VVVVVLEDAWERWMVGLGEEGVWDKISDLLDIVVVE